MNETGVLGRILKAVGCLPFLRVWRNNTGQTWTGNSVQRFAKQGTIKITVYPGDVLIRDAHPVKFGLTGSADIIGLVAPYGRFLAIEVKDAKGRQSEQQKRFEEMVKSMGGIYFIARSPKEALQKINELTGVSNGGKD